MYISPSTQEHNEYIIGGTEEYHMNLVGNVVCAELRRHKIKVYRNNPQSDFKSAVEDGNSKVVNAYIALHSNAGGGTGCEVYFKKGDTESKKLAEELYKRIAPLTPTEDRGIKETTKLYEVTNSIAPAALIEYAFHDNIVDAIFIKNNIKELGLETAKAILSYLDIKFIPRTIEIQKTYTVKAGDTLYSIARKILGDPKKYLLIAKQNKITPPFLIWPGQKLKIAVKKASKN